MLELRQIETFYPPNLRPFKKNMLREYLQYKILQIIFDSPFGRGLCFMGGTAARIAHGNTRFSEDLDFDNLSLNKQEFEEFSKFIERQLRLEGYSAKAQCVVKRSMHCRVKFENILFDNKISGHREEKLLIQVDAESQKFSYVPQKVIINKFDIFTRINLTSPELLLAQKFACIFTRKRPMGRDFYDIMFLAGKAQPDFKYLKDKLAIGDKKTLKEKVTLRCEDFNFKQLAKDVEPFLFNAADAKKILAFQEYIEEVF